jgi:hypothetical protein
MVRLLDGEVNISKASLDGRIAQCLINGDVVQSGFTPTAVLPSCMTAMMEGIISLWYKQGVLMEPCVEAFSCNVLRFCSKRANALGYFGANSRICIC